MNSCFALVLILAQILISGKEVVFLFGKESHRTLFCEAKPYTLLVGEGRRRNAAVGINSSNVIGVYSLPYFWLLLANVGGVLHSHADQ